ncbi:AI-2E family transporter [Lysinibacillus capsici]|uniref:AI-2E family transporter n=1 Tax=Lysinibacillus capsici TaxID=2115968 RepID=A0A2X0XF00_9BACI|nr:MULTISPECIES: AI-2E family transporter [Lysinibacillus]AUS88713.1 AI-2E family transporter [Lysinibacillus sp. YS11]KMN38756.1 membrane protein [Lysinibacillus sp. LK3]MCM0624835.1 AI-2E family transporter [Lysinibacillus sp. OL1_EC]MCR6524177.1 AI-2E family transporter [Lysinibacillus capsici]MCS5502649.1 AI-2E family transporter [Lysinibacillus sp. A4]
MNNFFRSNGFKRFIILVGIALALYLMRSMINLILLTFIITYLMNQLTTKTTKSIRKYTPMNEKAVTVTLYLLLVAGIVAVIYKYLPIVTQQITQLFDLIASFNLDPDDNEIARYLAPTFEKIELGKYLEQGVDLTLKNITNIGKIIMQILISLILSLFILLEKNRIIEFTAKFKDSKIGPLYDELHYFSRIFIRSFGKVIEAQFIIAAVNCVLSVIALSIMGFPHLIALGIMLFILGLVPVAGVIISLIPLSIIAYSIGGLMYIVYILVIVMVLHAIEAYFLNPKLMSAKTDLPIFYTFMVILFSEHFLGVWGLIIGIPLFMFLLDILGVTSSEDPAKKSVKVHTEKQME